MKLYLLPHLFLLRIFFSFKQEVKQFWTKLKVKTVLPSEKDCFGILHINNHHEG